MQLLESLALLNDWVRDHDANIRRFAIELTRPNMFRTPSAIG
ncbi:hypothetical protein HPL003_16500 [Paenibacillus terrae HPL-003]|uniref:Uncharacterized protein n=1 Tax=Paenibacillus terrae (strain HPL-003) TaxID=985665 RepID=G7W2E2_PAETH|nr:hypothetical protein HPL003_16500 [Paenibacillus terrae HPL-003]